MGVVSFTTDFGVRDWFVGTLKGVLLRVNPRLQIVDLSPDIPAGGVSSVAFALASGCAFFPKGTIHLVVVDPGVGSDRAALVARTANHFFVGPDNGVLTWALERDAPFTVHRIEN